MKWNPHQDMENRAYSHILTTLFPEQTRTLPRIIIWSIVFLLDLILCVFYSAHLGFLYSRLGAFLTLAGVLSIFWLQGKLWEYLVTFFQKGDRA